MNKQNIEHIKNRIQSYHGYFRSIDEKAKIILVILSAVMTAVSFLDFDKAIKLTMMAFLTITFLVIALNIMPYIWGKKNKSVMNIWIDFNKINGDESEEELKGLAEHLAKGLKYKIALMWLSLLIIFVGAVTIGVMYGL